MGNPNRRKNSTLTLIVKTSDTESISGHDGADSPKSPPGENHKYGRGDPSAEGSAQSAEKKEVKGKGKAAEAPVIIAPKPARPVLPLAFKSYKTGSLITDNFLPTPLPVAISPFLSPKSSPLNATSLSFIPSPKRVPAPNPLDSKQNLRLQVGPQQLQMLVPAMPQTPTQPLPHRTPPSQPRAFNLAPGAHHTPSKPSGGLFFSQILEQSPPTEIAVLPARAPTTFLAKKDKLRKDIVISATGVKRNIARITERYLPNGAPYQTHSDEFDEWKYDFMTELGKMKEEERMEFVSKSCIEVLVPMKSPEDENAEFEAKKSAKLSTIAEEGSASSSASSLKSLTKALVTKKAVEISAIIATLQSLPADFINSIEKLTVTMQFPTIASPAPTRSGPPSRGNLTCGNSTHGVSPDTSYQGAPNFVLMIKVVAEIHKFSNIKKLDVIIAPPSNMRTPMTLPQINCVLPFYDLEFTDWRVLWQTTFMSKPEPLRSWPLDYLNRERDRICVEREEKLRDLVFVTKSVASKLYWEGEEKELRKGGRRY